MSMEKLRKITHLSLPKNLTVWNPVDDIRFFIKDVPLSSQFSLMLAPAGEFDVFAELDSNGKITSIVVKRVKASNVVMLGHKRIERTFTITNRLNIGNLCKDDATSDKCVSFEVRGRFLCSYNYNEAKFSQIPY